jgi:hypothetical protein
MALAVVWGSVLQAAPPWTHLIPFRQAEPKTPAGVELTESQGPWMIFTAAFRGPGAESDALELVDELRRRYKLSAYTHRQHYDFTESVRGLGVDPLNRPKRMRYMQSSEYDEIAVLVGNFTTLEDPAVQQTLETIKYAQPKCLSGDAADESSLTFASFRRLQRKIGGQGKRSKGPLGSAFVTRNPLLPREYFAPSGIDPELVELNRGMKYSLLDCPGKYTVRVASFRGEVVIDQQQVQRIEAGQEQFDSRLEEAAMNAQRLTLALRRKGIEAYQFHDRYESVVTVGSFDSIGTSLLNGQTEIDPQVAAVIKYFSPSQQPMPGPDGSPVMGLRPKSLDKIPFDVQPIPVEVPRRSIAMDYAH